MGGKRTGAGKYFFCLLAVLICLSLAQCGSYENSSGRSAIWQKIFPRDDARERLLHAQELMKQNNYDLAADENKKVLILEPTVSGHT